MVSMPPMGIDGELGAFDAPPAGDRHFGEHFMIDAYRGSREKLLVQQCLSELPERLGMQKLAEPTVHWAEPNGIKDPGGWSGVVVIVESHISIHTFPGRRFASIDVYTCRNGLPTAKVEAYFREVFGFEELETNFVVRGTKYPGADF
jgi:S-adenosylmethionine decarboxylase